MKVLITGNMGYVGSALVRFLKENNEEISIIGFDAGFFAHSITGSKDLPERHLSYQIFGDTRELPDNILAGVDAVVHLAAVSNDPMGNQFERVTREINRDASVNLAIKSAAAGVKNFVFASSCSMYGDDSGYPKVETDETNPLTAYAKSKIGTEDDLRAIDLGDMICTNLCFATACGMSDRLRLDLMLNDFVAGAMVDKKITILSDGSPWRPLIDVEDMARAINWACFRSEDAGGRCLSINTGSNNANFQVREYAEMVSNQIPGCTVSVNTDVAPDKRSYRVDFSLFEKLAPDFTPKNSIERSIQCLIEGFDKMNFNNSNYRNSSYMRLNILKELQSEGKIDSDLRWKI